MRDSDNNSFGMKAKVVPETNKDKTRPQILPERFNSISAPSSRPIVSRELSSVTSPRIVKMEHHKGE